MDTKPKTTAAQYRQHITDGLTHAQAVAQIGCNAATARTLKSRYTKQGATPEAKLRKISTKRQIADATSKAIADELQAAVSTYNTQAELTRLAYETQRAGIAATPPVVTVPRFDLQAARNAAVSLLLIAVVIGHAGLVWFDCADRWSVPGAIGGGVVFLIVLAALLLASDETKPRTSEAALWFVFVTDFAAWFVHFPVFRDRAQIGDIETGVFAGFLCAASFTALYLYRDSKLG